MSEKDDLKMAIEETKLNIQAIRPEHNQLKNNPKVKRYLELEQKLNYLLNRKHKLRLEYQQFLYEDCDHPLWYFLRSKNNYTTGDINWICQCLKCGLIEQEKNYYFWNHVILDHIVMGHGRKSSHSYKSIAKVFKKLAESEDNIEEINKTLIKQYVKK